MSIHSDASSRPLTVWLAGGALLLSASLAQAQRFSIEQIMSAPFAASLVAAPDTLAFAWASNRAGQRNIWVAQAQGATFKSAAATHYAADDGLELSELTFVPHAAYQHRHWIFHLGQTPGKSPGRSRIHILRRLHL